MNCDLNLKDYGAAGDGATDDTQSFEEALAAATAAGGVTLCLPPGTYRVFRSLSIPPYVAVKFTPGAIVALEPDVLMKFAGPIESAAAQIFKVPPASTLPIPVAVVFVRGSQRCVYPDWWGPDTDTYALQRAIDAASMASIPVVLLNREYNIGSTGLVINQPYTAIIGVSDPTVGNDDNRGPQITFTGGHDGSVAITIGKEVDVVKPPSEAYEFLTRIRLENFRLRLAENTAIGIHAWAVDNSVFRNLTVFGSVGKVVEVGPNVLLEEGAVDRRNIGVKLSGTVTVRLENVDISGQGGPRVPPLQSFLEYLDVGLLVTNLPGGKAGTTTTVSKSYLHYCKTACDVRNFGNFYDCVFEASDRGVYLWTNAVAKFINCWWEANGIAGDPALEHEALGYFSGGSTAMIVGGTVMAGDAGPDLNVNTFLHVIQDARVTLDTCMFQYNDPDHVQGRLFPRVFGSSFTNGIVEIRNCSLGRKIKWSDSPAANWHNIRVSGMAIVVYRFKQPNLAVASYDPVPTEDGSTFYLLPTAGCILGVNAYLRNATASFEYDVRVNRTSLRYAAPSPLNSSQQDYNYWDYPFLRNDTLSVAVTVSSVMRGAVPAEPEMAIEVFVALGNASLS